VTAALAAGPVDQTFVDRSRDAALVVVEHRRRSRLARYRRPSTAAMLAGRVHCPLVAVPEDWHARPRSTGVITIGIDAVDHETETLLGRGFSLAAREGARLRLGHAWTMSSPYDDAVVDAVIEKDWSEAYQTRLERLLAPYRQAQPAVEVSVEVVHRRPADALVTWSQASDMVLLGRGRLVHPLVDGLGSVPRAVLEDGCCPIAVAAP
jgi:nucleotide-binding universal stress UspA family protein